MILPVPPSISIHTPQTNVFSPTVVFTPEVQRIIMIAFELFISNHAEKIYFSSDRLSYIKDGTSAPLVKLPHSIRRENETTFHITAERKALTTKIGSGTYKCVKKAMTVTVISENELRVDGVALVKDKNTSVTPPSRILSETLADVSYIETFKKIIYRTSKGTFKQFHIAEEALCSAHSLITNPLNANYYEHMKICHDIVQGFSELYQMGYVHGDSKPDNVLVYFKNKTFSAKLTDLDTVSPIDSIVYNQTSLFLSPLHKMQIIKAVIIKNGDTSKVPTEKEIEDKYIEFLHTNILRWSPKTAICSVGITLCNIGLHLQSRKDPPTADQMRPFWEIVAALTGGFSPGPTIKTIYEYNTNLIHTLTNMLLRKERINPPTITLEIAAAKLGLLARKPLPITLPLSRSLAGTRFEFCFPLPDDMARIPILEKIEQCYQLIFSSIRAEKIYFDSGSNYIKQINRSGSSLINCIYKISDNVFAAIFDRKLSQQKKPAWVITVISPMHLRISEQYLMKDRTAKREKVVWPIEALDDLEKIEKVTSINYKTSSGLYRRFHLAHPTFCNAEELFRYVPTITFAEFIQICKDILLAISELNLRGFSHMGLQLRDIEILSAHRFEGPFIPRISASSLILEQKTSVDNLPLATLSPRLRCEMIQKVKVMIPLPNSHQIINHYLNNVAIRTCIPRKSDILANAGLVLATLGLQMKPLLITQSPPTSNRFWKIISSLTGKFTPKPDATNIEDFYFAIDSVIIPLKPNDIPTPTTTLSKAIDRLGKLIGAP